MHLISNQRFMVLMDRLLKVFNIQVSSTSGSDRRFFSKTGEFDGRHFKGSKQQEHGIRNNGHQPNLVGGFNNLEK
jgi:hypothetical protein